MITSLNGLQHIFFIGVAGTGMSALAQYLSGIGKTVTGSDRYFGQGQAADIKEKLEAENIACFPQDGTGITSQTQLVIVSTAVEETNEEYKKAVSLNIPIIKRSQLLALICKTKRTIAVAGTSGKSTTSAMLFTILQHAGLQPSIISGAGLVSIQEQGKIGNAFVGQGNWLVIEADESDKSIVSYTPEIGLLLNMDKDHQEMDVLIELFTTFKNNTSKAFIINQNQENLRPLSQNVAINFGYENNDAGINATHFAANGVQIQFNINNTAFTLQALGKHNMENAAAATAVANYLGVPLQICANALATYKGIYRRNQILGNKNGVLVIDDYAHNPAKCAAAIRAAQYLGQKVIAWFQPHGYGPTRFLKNEFVQEISSSLRNNDVIIMSEIFYAGGTATKDISSNDLIQEIKNQGKQAAFIEDRNELPAYLKSTLQSGDVLLLMGARDPSLETFARQVYNAI
jgi:UDP-N-acetylmuramate--alanine ligase